MSDFISESELQALIEDAIKNEKLSEIIIDEAGLLEAVEKEEKGRIPHFSLDRLCRRSAIMAGATVLESLNSLILLKANKNVSMTKKESLNPDAVCFSPEKESIVIFELKISKGAGRQAITELAAYEQEIKNHLPLISEHDIQMVLVSSEWSVLMDHSVSAAITWSGKKILCLLAEKDQGKLVLKTRIPQAWAITGSTAFPREALVTMTLCLYDYKSDSGSRTESEIDPRLMTALKVMGRTGDALGSHGFAFLWKDHWDQSMTAYNVTICCVSPFGLFKESRSSGVIEPGEDSFVDILDDLVKEISPTGHSGAFFAIGKSAFPLLEELYSPSWEGCSFWEDERENLIIRAEPLVFEFWGSLGRYAINYVTSTSMRNERPGLLLGNLGCWDDPRVAIPLIDQMVQPKIFTSGNVRWKDAFQLGFLLGLDRVLRQHIEQYKDDARFLCRYYWNSYDVQYALDEVEYLSNCATNINPPEHIIGFQYDPAIDDGNTFDFLLRWIMDEFLMEEPGHLNAFICGLQGAPLFDEKGFKTLFVDDALNSILKHIEERMRGATEFVLRGLFEQSQDGALLPKSKILFEELKEKLGLTSIDVKLDLKNVSSNNLLKAWRLCLDASDFVVHGVQHRQNAANFESVDWDWLKQGVMEAHQRGETNVGIILNVNGALGTGNITMGGLNITLPKCDPAINVNFYNEMTAFASVRLMTWDELKAMKTYGGFSKKDDAKSES